VNTRILDGTRMGSYFGILIFNFIVSIYNFHTLNLENSQIVVVDNQVAYWSYSLPAQGFWNYSMGLTIALNTILIIYIVKNRLKRKNDGEYYFLTQNLNLFISYYSISIVFAFFSTKYENGPIYIVFFREYFSDLAFLNFAFAIFIVSMWVVLRKAKTYLIRDII
jgi:hypothetical protein